MPRGNTPRQPARSGRQEGIRKARSGKNCRCGPADRPDGRGRPSPHGPCVAPSLPAQKSRGKKAYNPIAPERVQEILQAARHPLSRRHLRPAPQERMGAAGRDYSFRPVDRRSGEHGHAGTLSGNIPRCRILPRSQPEQLQPDVRSTGFFRNKSKSVVGAAKKIVSDFGGQVPDRWSRFSPCRESRERPPT